MKFEKYFIDKLFLAENQSGDRGFIALVIPDNAAPPSDDTLTLREALGNTSYRATFVFSAQEVAIANQQAAKNFHDSICRILSESTREFIWLTDPSKITTDTVYQAQISLDGTSFTKALDAKLTPSLTFQIQSGIKITVDSDDSTLLFNAGQIQFSGPSKPAMKPVLQGQLPVSGRLRGCVQFTGYIQQISLQEKLQWGFQYLIPNAKDPLNAPPLSEWLPFADPNIDPNAFLGFNISIDPSDSYNDVFDPSEEGNGSIATAYDSRRTFLDFTGKNWGNKAVTTKLRSFYRSVFGAEVVLIPATAANSAYPARLVISPGERISTSVEHFHLCPEGDFFLTLPNIAEVYNHSLCCGLIGTEFFQITPHTEGQSGDILRFISRKPAYILNFPFPDVSPVGPPTDPTASPFNSKYRTSWATLVANSGNQIIYVSQPQGAVLFGEDKLIATNFPDLFGHQTPGFLFNANEDTFFPLLPYQGLRADQNTMSVQDTQNLEKTVLSPQRRAMISVLTVTANTDTNIGEPAQSTTPSGLIATTRQTSDGAVQWDEVNLGWNEDNGHRYRMAFEEPPEPLINALQSSDVFLVVANSQNIGSFKNQISLSHWGMQVNIGTNQAYGDYRNLMIFKGRKGKLYDPDDPTNSLVANPKKWTQSQDFAVPATSNAQGQAESADNSQLVILSQWLQTYFEQAQQQKNPYFQKFNDIAQLESWTGILFLRVDIDSLPKNLTGILAGVTVPDAFNAHHFGIEISPVTKGNGGEPSVDQPSSLFGLIYYVDPDFSDTKPVKSIAPTNSDSYNFRLLSLKVLFENTTVKSFESYAQLTLNQLFGATVTKMGNPDNVYKNVLLTGSLQINNGKAVYSLSSQNDDAFYFDNNIVNKIEITDVLLSTRSDDKATDVVSWFGMTGFIDFLELTNSQNQPFDLFSFGNQQNQDHLKQGLNFSNLGIKMSFPENNPANNHLTFDPSEIAFDLSLSTPRKNSLYLNMVLDLDSLVTGPDQKSPKDSGYLDVLPDLRLGGVAGGDWYGLRFKLNMGTPGELAGKVHLDSYLLLSWSPDSNKQSGYKAGVGIELPGTGGGARLISLQNVMKLSIGQIRLSYVKVQDSQDQYSFLLLFTEIALKFLGLLKIPPNGNTLFYLFGNPNVGGKTSGLGWYAIYTKDRAKDSEAPQTEATRKKAGDASVGKEGGKKPLLSLQRKKAEMDENNLL